MPRALALRCRRRLCRLLLLRRRHHLLFFWKAVPVFIYRSKETSHHLTERSLRKKETQRRPCRTSPSQKLVDSRGRHLTVAVEAKPWSRRSPLPRGVEGPQAANTSSREPDVNRLPTSAGGKTHASWESALRIRAHGHLTSSKAASACRVRTAELHPRLLLLGQLRVNRGSKASVHAGPRCCCCCLRGRRRRTRCRAL